MASRVIVLDDLDQTEGAEMRRFSVGDKHYEVDLTDDNWAKLGKALDRFVKVARDVTPAPRRPAVDPYEGIDQGAVREWAVAEGLDVNPKGRISLEVVAAYKRAQTEPDQPGLSIVPD